MWYIITFFIGCAAGIVIASLLSAAKRADEWGEAYHKGYEKGKAELLKTPVKNIISVENYGIVPLVAEVCVPSDEAYMFPEAVKEAVERQLLDKLEDGIKPYVEYRETYDPVYQRVEYRARVKIAKRSD